MVLKLHHLSTFRKCRISPRKTLCYLKGGETSFIWYHFEWLSFLLINGDWKRPGERSEMLNTRPISKDMSICLCLSTITRHMRCFQVEDDAKIELITTKDAINPPKQECIVHKFPVCVCVAKLTWAWLKYLSRRESRGITEISESFGSVETHTTPPRPLENEVRVIDYNPCSCTCKAKEKTSVRPLHKMSTGIAANEP